MQGVGFRPFVYNLAKEFGIEGWVANVSGGVYIRINAGGDISRKFLNHIVEKKPSKARILSYTIDEIKSEDFDGFSINNSFETESGRVIFSPDFAMCNDCEKELYDKKNKRYKYPFITCTSCGPRYSIINKLPFDREYTTMHGFAMCESCKEEYNSTDDIRFYSQTNSCSKCGVKISLYNGETEEFASYDSLISKVVSRLNRGGIVAVKGVGGYLLLADASDKKTVKTLRQRKNRPTKPFALLVNDESALDDLVFTNEFELESWNSQESEIVLFNVRPKTSSIIALDEIAPGLDKIGVMRPYAPLLKLIADDFGKVLIATSANLSGSPIVYQDSTAKDYLTKIADLVMLNNREIVIPQDDSVVQFSKKGTRIVLRRSRGIAPNYFGNPVKENSEVLAVGSLLKSAFSFYKNQQFYISQYLGNTDYFPSQIAYENTFYHIKSLLKAEPKVVICDLHPNYFSTQFAEILAKKENIRLEKVQHHEAHFAAVLGENQLLGENVLGFVWDGTGLGDDGEIWGAEVFELKNKEIKRIYHSKYEKHILGDKMVNEPRLSALSFFNEVEGADRLLKEKFSKNEYHLYSKLINKSTLLTSSMGRFFDAVASILLKKDISRYEGEAAMLLESLANSYRGSLEDLQGYTFDVGEKEIDFYEIKKSIINDVNGGREPSEIAMCFHLTMVDVIKAVSEKEKQYNLAFSGGVFQNALLINLLEKKLSKQNNLYFHKQLSPNDECISFGQIISYSLNRHLE